MSEPVCVVCGCHVEGRHIAFPSGTEHEFRKDCIAALRVRAEKAEAELAERTKQRDLALAECRAWRGWKSNYHAAALKWSSDELTAARAATDAAGLLKEAADGK